MQKPSNHVASIPTQAEVVATKIEEFGLKNVRSLFTNTTASISPNGVLSIVGKKKDRKSMKGSSRQSPYTRGTLHKERSQDRSKNYKTPSTTREHKEISICENDARCGLYPVYENSLFFQQTTLDFHMKY